MPRRGSRQHPTAASHSPMRARTSCSRGTVVLRLRWLLDACRRAVDGAEGRDYYDVWAE